MKDCEILKLRDHPRWKEEASAWFASKWGIPREEYLSSMDTCLAGQVPVPQWYIVVDAGDIIAGLGVIENDFHNRKDLAPQCLRRLCGGGIPPPGNRQSHAGLCLPGSA